MTLLLTVQKRFSGVSNKYTLDNVLQSWQTLVLVCVGQYLNMQMHYEIQHTQPKYKKLQQCKTGQSDLSKRLNDITILRMGTLELQTPKDKRKLHKLTPLTRILSENNKHAALFSTYNDNIVNCQNQAFTNNYTCCYQRRTYIRNLKIISPHPEVRSASMLGFCNLSS